MTEISSAVHRRFTWFCFIGGAEMIPQTKNKT
jgi:hypothetical protein